MTTKQHTLDKYTDARNYSVGSLATIMDILWDAGAMTKDINERLHQLIKDEEEVHDAVLNIYEAYNRACGEINDDN